MAIASAVGVVAQGAVERAVADHAGFRFAHLFGGEQAGRDAQFIQKFMGRSVAFQCFRGAGQMQQTLMVAIEGQIKLLFQSQKPFPAVDAEAQHGAAIQTEQARRPGVTEGGEHEFQGFHRRRKPEFQWAVLLEDPGYGLEHNRGIGPGVDHTVGSLGRVGLAGLASGNGVAFQHSHLVAPAIQLVGRGHSHHAATDYNNVHAFLRCVYFTPFFANRRRYSFKTLSSSFG